LSGQSVRMYWRVFRVFFKWCAENELITESPAASISQPKAVILEVIPFTEDEIQTMLKSAGSKRNRALIMLLLDTGVRVGEMSRMMVKDLNQNTNSIQIHPFMSGIKSKSRTVYIGKKTQKSLWLYLAERGDLNPEDPLISTIGGSPLDRHSVKCIFKRLIQRTGIQRIYAHKFRHTFAIEYLRSGGDVFTLQTLLGHSSLDMVRHYCNIASLDIAEAHRRNSPVDRLKI